MYNFILIKLLSSKYQSSDKLNSLGYAFIEIQNVIKL